MIEKIKSLFLNNKLILIVSFIAGLITHFYFYTNEVISPDALYTGNLHISGEWESSIGRWGIQFVDILRGGFVNSFLITVVCIFILSITTIILVKLLKIKNSIIITLLSILMVVTPQVAETLMFIYSADAYCFAMLFSVLAVYFIYEGNSIKRYLLAIVFIILTLSLYQSYIGVTVSLCVLILIIELLDGQDWKEILKVAGKSIVIGIIGMLLYYGITILILKLSNKVFSSYGGANNIGISTIKSLIPETLNTYKTFYKYFFKESFIYNKFWHRDIINLIIALVTIINIIIIIVQNKLYKKKINLLLLSLFILILPISINVINIIAPDRDNNLVMGMSYVLIYVLVLKISENMLKYNKINKILPQIAQASMAIMIFTFVLSNNASYMARKNIYDNYYSTSIRILEKIENYDGYNENTKVLIGGLIKYKPAIAKLGNGFISNDYETWNNYDGIAMINNFYYNYMGTTINLCDKLEYLKIIDSDEYKNMNKFPYDGCIKMIDGVLVVKLENNPER